MKALTLTQPWASLVACGRKRIETRSWATEYRGPLAIHAAKGWTADDRAFADELIALGAIPPLDGLPRGAVVATCRLVHCAQTVTVPTAVLGEPRVGNWTERDLGDFRPGRFAWWLADVEPLPEPILVRGALGLWEWATPEPEAVR